MAASAGWSRRAGTSTSPHRPASCGWSPAENIYGNIAAQIGGRRVHVTSVLTDPNADPHLFEPGTDNGLAVARRPS